MGIGNRLSKLMDVNGTNANELAKQINVSPQTIYSIIKRDSKKADIEVLLKIADVFGVTAEYFVDEAASSHKSLKEKFSQKELEHLKAYCNLDLLGRDHVDIVTKWEAKRMEELKQAASSPAANHPSLRLIQYYQRLASAGSGQYIFDNIPSEQIEIPDIPEYKKVRYALGVNGHSMEPDYLDGEIVLVEPVEEVEIGEIGIFMSEGEAFIKKRGRDFLISLNKPEYEDVPLSDSTRCIGRVIGKL